MFFLKLQAYQDLHAHETIAKVMPPFAQPNSKTPILFELLNRNARQMLSYSVSQSFLSIYIYICTEVAKSCDIINDLLISK